MAFLVLPEMTSVLVDELCPDHKVLKRLSNCLSASVVLNSYPLLLGQSRRSYRLPSSDSDLVMMEEGFLSEPLTIRQRYPIICPTSMISTPPSNHPHDELHNTQI
jgi:hypothetical protein